jgi:hypothetical protein
MAGHPPGHRLRLWGLIRDRAGGARGWLRAMQSRMAAEMPRLCYARKPRGRSGSSVRSSHASSDRGDRPEPSGRNRRALPASRRAAAGWRCSDRRAASDSSRREATSTSSSSSPRARIGVTPMPISASPRGSSGCWQPGRSRRGSRGDQPVLSGAHRAQPDARVCSLGSSRCSMTFSGRSS